MSFAIRKKYRIRNSPRLICKDVEFVGQVDRLRKVDIKAISPKCDVHVWNGGAKPSQSGVCFDKQGGTKRRENQLLKTAFLRREVSNGKASKKSVTELALLQLLRKVTAGGEEADRGSYGFYLQ